jgi:hypothetical protein
MQNQNSNKLNLYSQAFNSFGEKIGNNINLGLKGRQYHVEKLTENSLIIIVDSLVQILSKDHTPLIPSFYISTGYNLDFDIGNDSLLFVVFLKDIYIPDDLLDEDIYIGRYNIYNNADHYDIVKINDDSIGYWQTWARIAIENNNIIVAWMDSRNSGYKYQSAGPTNIYGQRFNLNLEKIGENFKVSHEQNCSSQGFSSVNFLKNKITLVWLDGRSLEYFPVSPPKVKDNIWGTIQDFNNPIPGDIIHCTDGIIIQDTTIHPVDKLINEFEIFPNPTLDKLNIILKFKNPLKVKITIYDILGAEVTTLMDNFYDFTILNNTYSVNNLSSGVYLINVSVFDSFGKNESRMKKLIIIK